ncbi:Ldh family oxidoreductase [Pseudonocardia kunmingensis]|uniref:Ldh family oxidoreductase n=1 Tax=Pseudonocardia kunmingensis TaxID=630975 RepID=UPI00147859EC|nr:Ldh family oxidoreductase [Pseudonocardia kunmingensis]
MDRSTAYRRGDATAAAPRTVPLARLRGHCAAVFRAAGLDGAAADLVADSLVDAEARGIGSHGVNRTRIYAERLRGGMIDAAARPAVVREQPGGVHIDAGNAIGHLGAQAGTDAAVERALQGAVCVAGVANSNHCGTLAYFTRQVAARGLVAIAMSTAPPTMVYFGGRTRAVGTNPVSMAVPRAGGPPVTVDMATSATARGKIILAHQLGTEIPDGWAVDEAGRPTTDPAAALLGSVLPFAGPKGSGLAMMVELLCGALVAGVTADGIGDMYEDWTRTQRVSHLFIVLNPDGWLGREAFLAHVEAFARRVHDLPPAEGFDQVLLPGEVEENARAAAERDGVTLSASVAADLDAIAAEVGLDHRLTTAPR